MKLSFKKNTWAYRSEHFTIEVVNIKDDSIDLIFSNQWFIYCYLYKGHFLFDSIKGKSLNSCHFPFHCGCTINKWYYDHNGSVISKELGCDYVHSGDEEFCKMETQEEAREVFEDAKKLFEFLTEKELVNE